MFKRIVDSLIDEICENECDAIASIAILVLVGTLVLNCFKGI